MTKGIDKTKEAAHIDVWAKRKERIAKNAAIKAASGRTTTIRKLRNGQVIDADFIRKLKHLYLSDMSVKRIAMELDCGTNTVNRLRRELDLPLRHRNNAKPDYVYVKVLLDPSLTKKVDHYIFGRYRSRSAYIRALIKRDMML